MLPALLAAALLHPPAEAARRSTVFVGDFAPEDRSSIDAFCRRYDRLDGDLVIGARFRGQDLQHLGCLVSLTGEVRIEGAPLIRNLDGIEAWKAKGAQLSDTVRSLVNRVKREGNAPAVSTEAANG